MTVEVGNIFFERAGDGSPQVYTRICEVFSIGGVGETNSLVDKTNFCSGGFREYIGGLSDGAEVTIELEFDQASPNWATMIADVKAKTVRDYRLMLEAGSPSEQMLFSAVPLSWTLNPSVDDKNTISFGFKISGEITIP